MPVKERIGIEHDELFIGGEWVVPSNLEALTVVNPAAEQVLGHVPAASKEDADAAVRAARAAFPAWSSASTTERASALRAFADALAARRDELVRLLIDEVGIPARLAQTHQVQFPIDELARQASMIESLPLEERIGNSLVVREPIGVVAALAPWNFPLLLAVNKIAPALAAGCTVVLKPSELTPLHAFVLAEAAEEADLPPGILNMVTGTGPEMGEALAAHPDVDMVSLTGSTAAGRRVAELAARTLKRVLLELGGKSANVLLEGADVESAVRAGIDQCFWNNGQNCMAWSRLLAPRAIADDVAARAGEIASALRVGDPREDDTDIGPLVSAEQRDRVCALVRSGSDEGARLVTGGTERPAGHTYGYYVRPTVFADVTNDMRIAREEIFGPVLSVLPYDGEDEAVQIANDTPYGLHGAVFAPDVEHGTAVARRLRTGMVDVNGAPLNPHAPFGGYGQSGLGRELGRFGLEEYFELKAIQI